MTSLTHIIQTVSTASCCANALMVAAAATFTERHRQLVLAIWLCPACAVPCAWWLILRACHVTM